MSHNTHEHHHDNHNEKPVVQFKTGIIFPLMLAGLFLAAIAFVQSMSHSESGHGAAHETHQVEEEHHDANAAHHEATEGEHQEAAPSNEHQDAEAEHNQEHH